MKWILHHDPDYGVMMIAMIVGITAALRTSVIHGLHPLPDLIGHNALLDSIVAYGIGATAGLAMSAVTIGIYGSLLGVLLVNLGAFALWIVARVGRIPSHYRDVRAALIWAFVPYSWLAPLWSGYALLNYPEMRVASFSYGALFPWDIPSGLGWLLALDYAVRIFCLVLLFLKLSVALNTSVWRSTAIAAITLLPAAIFLAPWQGFGF